MNHSPTCCILGLCSSLNAVLFARFMDFALELLCFENETCASQLEHMWEVAPWEKKMWAECDDYLDPLERDYLKAIELARPATKALGKFRKPRPDDDVDEFEHSEDEGNEQTDLRPTGQAG